MPSGVTYGGVPFVNPFIGATWSPIQQQAFRDDPRNAFAYMLAANQTSGPRAVPRLFRSFLEEWLPEQFRNYSALGLTGSTMSFEDFLAGRNPFADYPATQNYASRKNLYAAPVRMLRR
jgi:hypothetical protein